eukprot:g4564.t1
MGRSRKDPLRPKRPITAFMAFSAARRRELTEEKPEWDFAALSRLVGKEWRRMSEAEREPYKKTQESDKARYSREMASYVPPSESSSEESYEDSDLSGSSSSENSDSASDDGFATSSSSEDDDEAGVSGSKSLSHGPPYPRKEYCTPAAHPPEISRAIARLLPHPSTVYQRAPSATQLRCGRNEDFWNELEKSAFAASKAHWDALSVVRAAKSPLPGFGKHMILSQTRRQMACFVSVLANGGTPQQEHIRSSMPGPAAESPANGKRAMTPKAVSELYSTVCPIYLCQCDLLVIPCLDELLAVPKRMLAQRDPDFLATLSQYAGKKDSQIRVRRPNT